MATATEPRLMSDVGERFRETQFALWDGDLACTDRVSDELLASSYLRFKAQGLLSQIFYEGEPSLMWFMEHFAKAGRVEVLAVLKQDENQKLDLAGLGWLNSRTNVGGVFDKMEVGFGFFREYHGQRRMIVRATQLMIEFAFRALGIAAMVGTTPEHNVAAVRMAQRVGFELHGPVPHFTVWDGKPCGAFISSLTKDRWEQIKAGGY